MQVSPGAMSSEPAPAGSESWVPADRRGASPAEAERARRRAASRQRQQERDQDEERQHGREQQEQGQPTEEQQQREAQSAARKLMWQQLKADAEAKGGRDLRRRLYSTYIYVRKLQRRMLVEHLVQARGSFADVMAWGSRVMLELFKGQGVRPVQDSATSTWSWEVLNQFRVNRMRAMPEPQWIQWIRENTDLASLFDEVEMSSSEDGEADEGTQPSVVLPVSQ